MNAEPNLDHPLVEIASRLLRPDPVERWVFDDQAAQILEAALLSQQSDPTLASAVLGLFHLATDLHRTHGADAAAGRIFSILGAIGPRLFTEIPKELEDVLEKAARPLAPRALPAHFDAPPPEGTIPASKLQQANTRRHR